MAAQTPVRRGPGRPAVGTRVPVRLPPEVLDDIDRRARILGRSRASIIRSLLLEALGRSEDRDDGVDRAQIRRMLAMPPQDRVREMASASAQTEKLRARARRRAR